MGLDPSNLPENIRRAHLRPADPRSRPSPTWKCPHCGFTNGSLTAKCAACHKLPGDPAIRPATPLLQIQPSDRQQWEQGDAGACGRQKPMTAEKFDSNVDSGGRMKAGNVTWEEYNPTAGTKTSHPAPGESITFWVDGKPEPAGSKQAFCPTKPNGEPYRGPTGRIIINVVDDNPRSKEWKKVVARAARQHFTREPHDGPVECRLEFVVTRPQYHFGTGKNAERLKDAAAHFPTAKPDTLKLSRGTEDALTGIAWIDDSQVVNQTATKRYGTRPGVQITISAVTVIHAGTSTPATTAPEQPTEEELPLPL